MRISKVKLHALKQDTSISTNTLLRYKFLFDNSPIPIQEVDIKNVAEALQKLKDSDVSDIETYLNEHPSFIKELFDTTNVFDVNYAMLKMIEAENKAQYIRDFKKILGESCFLFFKQILIGLFNGQNTIYGETEITTFKGQKLWLEVTAIYLSNDEEEMINFTFHDITERKIKSRAIQLINERLAKGSHKNDFDNLVLAFAEAFNLPYIYIGYASEKDTHITTLSMAVNHEIEEPSKYLKTNTPCLEVYKTQEKVVYTNHLDRIFPNNSMIQAWCGKSYLGYPLFSENGKIIGHFAFIDTKPLKNIDVLQDVMGLYATLASKEIEHANDQKALNKSQNTLTNVLDNIGHVLYAFDLDLNVVAYNKPAKIGFKNLFGIDLEIGQKVTKGISNLSQDELDERFSVFKKVVNGETVVKERTFSDKGDNRFFVTTYSPMRNHNGDIIGCVAISRNQTNLFLAKQRLEVQNNTIQEQLKVLNAKNKELEKYIESNMQLENFAYIASHDLKTPIRTIISFAQLLKRKLNKQLEGDAKEYFDFIITSSHNMKQLIDDLLTYSRVNSQSLNKKLVNVERLIEYISLEIQSTIQEKEVLIQEHNLPTSLHADSTKLKQLFQNLITNGIKFHKEGERPIITVNAIEKETEWLFSVADNGIGIEPAYFDKIFVLFKKLHNNSEYEGTGLGLAICKKVVEQHNGRIWVESTYGEGTTFYFTIAK